MPRKSTSFSIMKALPVFQVLVMYISACHSVLCHQEEHKEIKKDPMNHIVGSSRSPLKEISEIAFSPFEHLVHYSQDFFFAPRGPSQSAWHSRALGRCAIETLVREIQKANHTVCCAACVKLWLSDSYSQK